MWGEMVMGQPAPEWWHRVPSCALRTPYLMMTHWFSPSISILRYMLSVRA